MLMESYVSFEYYNVLLKIIIGDDETIFFKSDKIRSRLQRKRKLIRCIIFIIIYYNKFKLTIRVCVLE